MCGGRSQYRDRHTGQYLCPVHARLEVVAAGRQSRQPSLTVRSATAADYERVKKLALYQQRGFRLTELIAGAIAQHHGGELAGLAGIPVRDEIRLEKPLSIA